MILALSGSIFRKSCASAWREISASAPASSTPVAPPPTTTNVSSRRWAVAITFPFGALKGDEHLPANRQGVLHRLEALARAAPTVVAEVVRAAARRDDEVVVLELAVAQDHQPARGVDRGRLGEPDAEVALLSQNPADRRRDVAGREPGGRDLIEQRLEDVMVVPVDERDVDRRLRERLGGAQAAEPAADDDDARTRRFSHELVT